MAEPFSKPQLIQTDKMQEFISDPLGFALVQNLMRELSKQDGHWHKKELAYWYVNTKKLIRDLGIEYIITKVSQMIYELSDEDYQWLQSYNWESHNKFIFPEGEFSKQLKEKGLTISLVAQKRYGLTLVKNRSKCPFHQGDNRTSLMLDDVKNRYKCWSCGASGNLVAFIKNMEELKND